MRFPLRPNANDARYEAVGAAPSFKTQLLRGGGWPIWWWLANAVTFFALSVVLAVSGAWIPAAAVFGFAAVTGIAIVVLSREQEGR